MKKMSQILIIVAILILNFAVNISAQVSDEYLSKIKDQLIKMDDTFDGRFPEYTIDGKYKYRDKVNWLSWIYGRRALELVRFNG